GDPDQRPRRQRRCRDEDREDADGPDADGPAGDQRRRRGRSTAVRTIADAGRVTGVNEFGAGARPDRLSDVADAGALVRRPAGEVTYRRPFRRESLARGET